MPNRGGAHEQHMKSGQQSHKNQSGSTKKLVMKIIAAKIMKLI